VPETMGDDYGRLINRYIYRYVRETIP
jgi:hypothetical protein